jgi:hypothetical protein
MSFDPFTQAKLMSAYNGLNTKTPVCRDIDNLDDLKKLAGVSDTSYGETTSEYASNLGKIQRERNIKAGSDDWFKLWFAKPLLTGERPYNK